jgi:hypothetical protein
MDSSINEAEMQLMMKMEIPKFKKSKSAKVGSSTYWWDTKNHLLVLLNSAKEGSFYPLASIGFVTDPRTIKFWTEGIEDWKKD